jgi:hypothetical protein
MSYPREPPCAGSEAIVAPVMASNTSTQDNSTILSQVVFNG